MEEPEYTRLGAVEVYTVGREALRTRDSVMEGLEVLLAPGYERAPETPQVAAEAIGGAIFALIRDRVKRKGPDGLPVLAPTATYITLAPFLGAEAYERAMEDVPRKGERGWPMPCGRLQFASMPHAWDSAEPRLTLGIWL
jgi:hypothetical protein